MEADIRRTILEAIREFSTPARPVYLVGGAVRDALLDRSAHDLDFVLPGETRRLAQEAACRLDGALYILDEERSTTRVVLEPSQAPGDRMTLDFASLRAADLHGDLVARDFTINAMAYDVAQPDVLIDPTGGLADLQAKQIRLCSPSSLMNDPVRVLRAVRQSFGFHFQLASGMPELMRAAAPFLTNVSAERVRDELFRMLEGSQVAPSVRMLDQVRALGYILPEMEALKGVRQTQPHVLDAWEHTFSVVEHLEKLLQRLIGPCKADGDPATETAAAFLKPYQEHLAEHFHHRLVPDRTLRGLLFMAALYHDIAKPQTQTITPAGRVRFLEHDLFGAKASARRGRALALSAAEINRLELIVENHMRVHFLAGVGMPPAGREASLPAQDPGDGEKPSRRSIYRFFKETGDAGVDICLLSLADTRGTYGETLPDAVWHAELRTCQALFEAYWEKSAEVVAPPRYLSGNDLIQEFNLQPGKLIGLILAAIREAQATGEVHDREEALAFARHWLERHTASEQTSNGEREG